MKRLSLLFVVAAAVMLLSAAIAEASAPVAFTKNMGQWPDSVLFRASACGATMWFTANGLYYQFTRRVDDAESFNRRSGPTYEDRMDAEAAKFETMVVKASFAGANPFASARPEGLMEFKCNYFLGNDRSKWASNVPNYSAIVIENIYPGVDLRYGDDGAGAVNYEFIAAPGADMSKAQVIYDGDFEELIGPDSRAMMRTAWGLTVEKITPGIARDGLASPLMSSSLTDRYDQAASLSTGETGDSRGVGVEYSYYLGGLPDFLDFPKAITVDESGCALITGHTSSSDFPVQNAWDSTLDGSTDVFIAKLSPTGDALLFSTYLGGSSSEDVWDITHDAIGYVYVAGQSSSFDFPTCTAWDEVLGGSSDGFVVKLPTTGDTLVFATFIGGSTADVVHGIEIDPDGLPLIAGTTGSPDFPTINAWDDSHNGGGDIFISKFSAGGNALLYSTYVGGSGADDVRAIKIDQYSCIYITGITNSWDFPTLNAYSDTHSDAPYSDAIVAKLSPNGDSMIYSTYLGGSWSDYSYDIAVDEFGCAYVTGETWSSDFPVINAFDDSFNYGVTDVFVTKLSETGSTLVYSTYLGGGTDDYAYGIGVDTHGRAYVCGRTWSWDFPMRSAVDTVSQFSEAFVTKFSSTGDPLVYSSYFGGEYNDAGQDLTLDVSSAVYMFGVIYGLGLKTPAVLNETDYGVFVTKFAAFQPLTATIESVTPNPADSGTTLTFAGRSENTEGTIVDWWWESDIDGRFGDSEDFTYSDLSVGVHTITYKIKDGNEAWCTPDTTVVNVTRCELRGDVNHDGEPLIDIGDLVYLADYMFTSGPPPPCWDEGDIDGSDSQPIDISDLVYLADYMFGGGPPPPPCP